MNFFLILLEKMDLISTIASELWTEILFYLNDQDLTSVLNTSNFFRKITLKKYKLRIKAEPDYNSIRYKKAKELEVGNLNYNSSIIYDFEIKFYPDNLYKLRLLEYRGKIINLPITLKEFEYVIGKKDNLSSIEDLELSENLEVLILSNFSGSTIIQSPPLPNKLKSLKYTNFTLPEKFPDSLENFYLSGKIISFPLKSFNNVKRLLFHITQFSRIDNIIEKFQNLLLNSKIIELDTNYDFIKNFNLPETIKILRINIKKTYIGRDLPYREEIKFFYIKDLTIKSIFLKSIESNIIAENLEILRLSCGEYKLEKNNLYLPKLKKLILDVNFYGSIKLNEKVEIIKPSRKIIFSDSYSCKKKLYN